MQKAIRECSPRTSLQKAPNASIEIFLAIDLFYCFSRIEIRNIEEHPFNPFTLHTQSPPVSCGFHPPIRGTSAGISRPKFVFQSLSWRCFVSSFFSPISPGDKKSPLRNGLPFFKRSFLQVHARVCRAIQADAVILDDIDRHFFQKRQDVRVVVLFKEFHEQVIV